MRERQLQTRTPTKALQDVQKPVSRNMAEPGEELNDYERQRLDRIKHNCAMLRALGFSCSQDTAVRSHQEGTAHVAQQHRPKKKAAPAPVCNIALHGFRLSVTRPHRRTLITFCNNCRMLSQAECRNA